MGKFGDHSVAWLCSTSELSYRRDYRVSVLIPFKSDHDGETARLAWKFVGDFLCRCRRFHGGQLASRDIFGAVKQPP